MDCEQVELLLVEWVFEPLRDPEVDWRGVREHLNTCAACTASLRHLHHELSIIGVATGRGAGGLCRSTEAPPSGPGTCVRSYEQASRGASNGHQRPVPVSRSRRRLSLLAADAAMAACLLLGVWAHHHCAAPSVPVAIGHAGAVHGPIGAAAMAEATEYDLQGRRLPPFAVAAGDTVTAGAGRRVDVRVWGRHRLRLEAGTRLPR